MFLKSVNENISAAKTYIENLKKQGKLPSNFNRTDPNSDYQKIINSLGKNVNYAYYFIKHYYDEIDKFQNVEEYINDYVLPILNYLSILKRQNIIVNIDKNINRKPIDYLKSLLTITSLPYVNEIPGIDILNDNIIEYVTFSKQKNDMFYNISIEEKKKLLQKLRKILNTLGYNIIIAAKYDKDKDLWVPDMNAILHWISPIWCIKSFNYFEKHLGDDDNIQYIFIKKDIFNEIKRRASKRIDPVFKHTEFNFDGLSKEDVLNKIKQLREENPNEKEIPKDKLISPYDAIVPINWTNPHYTSTLKPYVSPNNLITDPIYRFGVTTYPQSNNISLNKILDSSIEKVEIDAFNDANENVATLVKHNFEISSIDILVRSIFNLKISAFDVNNITLNKILIFLNINNINEKTSYVKAIENKNDIIVNNFIKNILNVYNKIVRGNYTVILRNNELVNEIYEFSSKSIDNFLLMLPILLIQEHTTPEILNIAKEFFTSPKYDVIKSRNMVNMLLPKRLIFIILDLKNKNLLNNKELENYIIQSYGDGLFIKEIPGSYDANVAISSVNNFKTELLNVYYNSNKNNLIYIRYLNIEHTVSLPIMFKATADLIYLYRKDYGLKLIKDNNWDKEVQFITDIAFSDEISNENELKYINLVKNILEYCKNRLTKLIGTRYSENINRPEEVNAFMYEKLTDAYLSNTVKTTYTYNATIHNILLKHSIYKILTKTESGKDLFNTYFSKIHKII